MKIYFSGNATRLRANCLLIAGLACMVGLCADLAAQRAIINDQWPIQGKNGPRLSPPNVDPTNECAKSVYVDSFIPKATITVFLSGTTVIGTLNSKFGFADVPLTHVLHINDKITATQTVNGVTSKQSAVMVVGKMPSSLPAPTIDPDIYACGRVVPVHNLISGVTVQVRDLTLSTVIGNGATPNLWGSDWDPVGTSPLVSGHQITAKQSACTGVASSDAANVPVKADPSPVDPPSLDTPIVGNDTITASSLYIGSVLQAFDHATSIGTGVSTASANWMSVAPPIAASSVISAKQTLCTSSAKTPPVDPTTSIPAPILVGPICPGSAAAIVRNSTINATLVLLENGAVVGYGGAAPGDVPLDIAPPSTFVEGDTVQVAEYIGTGPPVLSEAVVVGCTSATTYHNDNQRTGWNPHENTLTPANVTPSTFGLIARVPLDDQVDTQPLVVTNQNIDGQGIHTVVYVATEGNTVYAIDSWSGAILKSTKLGAPIPMPLGCNNNGPNVGINGTPTIDVATRTLYVVAYTLIGGVPTYQLHALDMGTLNDKPGSPKIISASNTLTGGTTFTFNAKVQRQRPALLQDNGNIYAGFGSFCDFNANQSRGWLLGWNQGTLAPLGTDELTNRLSTAPTPFYLSSIWMSGYGVAGDTAGNLFLTTGNSDPKGDTYNGTTNIQESVVKLAGDLSKVEDLFTPSNVFPLDQGDTDYGSGGVMVVPDQPGPMPHIAVAAGKDGRLFILDRDSMGGFHHPDIPKNVGVGGCWCGPSFFTGSDGVGRVVSSGGYGELKTWKINTAASPALQAEASASLVSWNGVNDPGFFTGVSSNGTNADTAIIWAVGRPVGKGDPVTLYAFNGTATGASLPALWSGTAGSWPNTGGNANLVPTVANARVYVASYKELAIFGLIPRSRMTQRRALPTADELIQGAPPLPRLPGAVFWGTIKELDGDRLTIVLRTGERLQVDLTEAMKEGTFVDPVVGRNVEVIGKLNADGILEASTMNRAKGPQTWGVDSRE
jgi:hypothetical protein